MIDLHTHTNQSDGSLAPEELVKAAVDAGLEALGVTDHDTFSGYDLAVEPARQAGLDLVCGIELSTRHQFGPGRARSVHVLAYFFNGEPPGRFRYWLYTFQRSRRDRNLRLARRLRTLGMDIKLQEVERLGRALAGRPHFAQIMVQKGYVRTHQEAFDRYLGDGGRAYTERQEPSLEAAVAMIAETGGLAAIAHPVRTEHDAAGGFEALIARLREHGLGALEVWHSDHSADDCRRYLEIAERLDLAVTGGSDFHGSLKPGVELGSGRGSLAIPRSVLDNLRVERTPVRPAVRD
jgi:predicted metal-dependent phosphoesterase TrpH